MTRSQATQALLQAKKGKGCSFEEIAAAVGAHEVWVTSVLMGQNSMTKEQAAKVQQYLSLDEEVAELLTECPMKGSLEKDVVADPLIYRFHEITQVYGTTIKALIHEKFGDGIMSAIDFSMDIAKQEDPKGDRVAITLSGKLLPYKKW